MEICCIFLKLVTKSEIKKNLVHIRTVAAVTCLKVKCVQRNKKRSNWEPASTCRCQLFYLVNCCVFVFVFVCVANVIVVCVSDAIVMV